MSTSEEINHIAEAYGHSIDALMVEQDWKTICIDIAKRSPETFLRAVTHVTSPPQRRYSADLDRLFLEHIHNGRKVDAIKMHRTIFNSSLKEAKDYVDSLIAAQRCVG